MQDKKEIKIQCRPPFKKEFFGFPCCSTREDLSIDVSITNVGLILTMLGRFIFSRGTDRQIGFWNPHMETCRHKKKKKKNQLEAQDLELAVACRSQYASPDDGY